MNGVRGRSCRPIGPDAKRDGGRGAELITDKHHDTSVASVHVQQNKVLPRAGTAPPKRPDQSISGFTEHRRTCRRKRDARFRNAGGAGREQFASESEQEGEIRPPLPDVCYHPISQAANWEKTAPTKYPHDSSGRPDVLWQTPALTPPRRPRVSTSGRARTPGCGSASFLRSPESERIPGLLQTGAFCTKKLPRFRSRHNRKGRV